LEKMVQVAEVASSGRIYTTEVLMAATHPLQDALQSVVRALKLISFTTRRISRTLQRESL
jgi:hypothetical protein